MKTDVQRTSKFTTTVVGSVSGVRTLADTLTAVESLFGEGMPGDAKVGLYADEQSTLRYHIEYDQTEILRILKEDLISYLAHLAAEEEAKTGDHAEIKRTFIKRLGTVLEGI